jgi:hypothetical protein
VITAEEYVDAMDVNEAIAKELFDLFKGAPGTENSYSGDWDNQSLAVKGRFRRAADKAIRSWIKHPKVLR